MAELYNLLTHFDLNLLVSLDALLAERHVTRAAERLFVSQPTMSGMLQRLRDAFDDPLLVRSGRDLELTARAEALREPLREVLVSVRQLMAAVPGFDPRSAVRNFRVVMSDYVSTVFLPQVVRRLTAEAPGLSFTVENVTAASPARLSSGEIDLCLTTDEKGVFQVPRQDDLVSTPVFQDAFVAVACASNARAFEGMSVEAFCALPHVQTQFGLGASTLEQTSLARQGLHYQTRVSMPSFGQVLLQLPNTDGLALAPSRLAAMWAPVMGLKVFASPIQVPLLREALIWHRRYDRDPGHTWLRQLLITIGRGMAPLAGGEVPRSPVDHGQAGDRALEGWDVARSEPA